MGQYTLHTDPRVDAIVASHLDEIRQCVLRRFQPEALLLSGSFGRGEGSVSLEGGQVRFYSDYEVSLISPRPQARLAIDPIQRDINGKLPLSVSLFWMTPRKLSRNLIRNLSFGPPYPSIGLYELKAGGQVFYGDFDLTVNQIAPTQLPISEGVRLIANRMMEVIEKWSQTRTPKSPDFGTVPGAKSGDFALQDHSELAFSLSKLILACGDALLLKNRLYHFSYAERAQRFQAEYPIRFQPLLGAGFLDLYRKAASFKLHPCAQVQPAEILGELAQIRGLCWQILGHLLAQGNEDTDRIFKIMAASMPITYRTGLSPALDVAYENLILSLRTRRAGKKLYLANQQVKRPRLSVFQQLYGAIPSLFWGLPLDQARDQPDQHLLQVSRKWSAWAFPNSQEPGEKFVPVLLSMWHAFG